MTTTSLREYIAILQDYAKYMNDSRELQLDLAYSKNPSAYWATRHMRQLTIINDVCLNLLADDEIT